MNLEEGVGLSLVNKLPEELVFTTLSGIDIHFTRTATNEVLELSVQNIQVMTLKAFSIGRQALHKTLLSIKLAFHTPL